MKAEARPKVKCHISKVITAPNFCLICDKVWSCRINDRVFLVSDSSIWFPALRETGENFFLAAGGLGRIVERPMMAVQLAGKNRARRIRVAANSDDGVNRLIQKFLQVFER